MTLSNCIYTFELLKHIETGITSSSCLNIKLPNSILKKVEVFGEKSRLFLENTIVINTNLPFFYGLPPFLESP